MPSSTKCPLLVWSICHQGNSNCCRTGWTGSQIRAQNLTRNKLSYCWLSLKSGFGQLSLNGHLYKTADSSLRRICGVGPCRFSSRNFTVTILSIRRKPRETSLRWRTMDTFETVNGCDDWKVLYVVKNTSKRKCYLTVNWKMFDYFVVCSSSQPAYSYSFRPRSCKRLLVKTVWFHKGKVIPHFWYNVPF